MSAVDAEIRTLAEEVASSFDAAASPNAPGHPTRELPSSITLYRTGRVLCSCHARAEGAPNGTDDPSGALIGAFEHMICSLPTNYLRDVLLPNLHHAYASLIVSFASSASTASPALSTITSMIGKSSAVSSSWKDIGEGTESICGIYLSSTTACQSCCPPSASPDEGKSGLELPFVSLSWVYDYLSNDKMEEGGNDKCAVQKLVLKTLSRLLVHGIVHNANNTEEDTDEQLATIMTLIQNIQSSLGEYNCALGDMVDLSEDDLGEQSFVAALRSRYQAADGAQPPQLQYLLAMLRASPKSNIKQPPAEPTEPMQREDVPPSEPPQQSMTDIQIDNVKGVLPDLGEGYIEEALRCYNHDVERTIEALLQVSEGGDNGNVHPRLLTIPQNLPRKLRDSVETYSANVNLHRGATAKEDGKEHAKIQKRHIKHVEKQAEEEAFLIDNVARTMGGLRLAEAERDDDDQYGVEGRDEYNDDYDDQYDGIGDDGGMAGGIGGMDEGLYDVDVHNVHQRYDRDGAKTSQDMWRKYNSLIKDVDAEGKFWEENRNLNREVRPGKGRRQKEQEDNEDEDGDGKKYRGLDKGKGGRLIGPDGKYLPLKRGGKKGRGGGGGDGGASAGRGAGRGGRGGKGGRGGGGGRGGANAKGDGKAGEGDNMSKIQKRRKNDNKAKVGNHHRKDRANKKAAGGMVM